MDKQASLLGVQNNKLGIVQNSEMSAENLEHSCSVVVKDLVTSSTHDTCGDRLLSTKGEYVEILEFTHFARVFKFTGKSNFGRKKEISNEIKVSVVIELV